jgi:hypothetical protein
MCEQVCSNPSEQRPRNLFSEGVFMGFSLLKRRRLLSKATFFFDSGEESDEYCSITRFD